MKLRFWQSGGGGGGGGRRSGFSMFPHDLAGAYHIADSITNLNTKLTDGDVISTKANEINALAAKAVPVSADYVMIEDSADTWNKKKTPFSALGLVHCAVINIVHTQFQAAALTNSIVLYALPAGGIVLGCRLKPSSTWIGGAITNYHLSIGVAGALQDLMTEYDAFPVVVADTEYAEAFAFQSFNYNAAVNLLITARSVAANLNASTQGAGVVEVFYIAKV